MSKAEEEAKWRDEFEEAGERCVHDTIYHGPGSFPEPKRHFALRWLRECEIERNLQAQQTRREVRWTFWAAVAAVIVGIIGVMVTRFTR